MTAKKQPLPDLPKAAQAALQRDVAWRARCLARRVSALADTQLKAAGLTHAQFILMCLIASATDDTVNALAQRAGLDQSTVSRNLDVLVKADLAEVTKAVHDRRRRAVWLTETGLFTLARALPLAGKMQAKLARRLAGLPLARGPADPGTRKRQGALSDPKPA